MTAKKKFKNKLLSTLRKFGLLAPKQPKPRRGIRVSKSVMPDGTETFYTSPLREVPKNENDLESAIHIFHEIKNSIKK